MVDVCAGWSHPLAVTLEVAPALNCCGSISGVSLTCNHPAVLDPVFWWMPMLRGRGLFRVFFSQRS